MRVLIVEDTSHVIEALRERLQDHEVVVAKSLSEALDHAWAGGFAAASLDYNFPTESGWGPKGNGATLATAMVKAGWTGGVILHSNNLGGKNEMNKILTEGGIRVRWANPVFDREYFVEAILEISE